MKYYVISDTHFLHDNIIKYCNRPIDYNQLIIDNWIKAITDDDKVFHLGDVACSVKGNDEKEEKLKEIFKTLPGKKYLVKGNHDKFSDGFYLDLGFESVHSYYLIKEYSMLLFHYPLRITRFDKKDTRNKIIEAMDIFQSNDIRYIVHGHTHNQPDIDLFHYSVSVERINYTPIRLDLVYKDLEERTENIIPSNNYGITR